jgi:5'-nucleotidase/UDP-sugar diphosphatase
LQAQLAAAGGNHQAEPASGSAPAPVATATGAATPPVPPRALPLDATNAAPAAATATAGGTESGGANRSYKVVSGDSLWKISHKMYPGDTKNGIDKIKDANKDTLIEGKPLKIGQVLVIPP